MTQETKEQVFYKTRKLEWRNPWFGSKDWQAATSTSLSSAVHEFSGPYHEETVLRDADTKEEFRRRN